MAVAGHYGTINLFYGALAVIGVVLSQMSVNLINDYYDFKSGLDIEQISIHTNFSGGSKMVGSGKVSHLHALYIGIGALCLAGVIGIYLALEVTLVIIPIIIVGAIAALTYTKYFTKFPLLPEPLAMLGFVLMGVGSFIVAHGSAAGLGGALFVLVPGGMLGGIQLLVNEVPDAEIDKKYGRKHASNYIQRQQEGRGILFPASGLHIRAHSDRRAGVRASPGIPGRSRHASPYCSSSLAGCWITRTPRPTRSTWARM